MHSLRSAPHCGLSWKVGEPYGHHTFCELQAGHTVPRRHARRDALRHAGDENHIGGRAARQRHQLPAAERLRRFPEHEAPLPQGRRHDVLSHGAKLSERRGGRSPTGPRSRAAAGGVFRRLRGAGLHPRRPRAYPLPLHHQLRQLRYRQKAAHGERTTARVDAAQ